MEKRSKQAIFFVLFIIIFAAFTHYLSQKSAANVVEPAPSDTVCLSEGNTAAKIWGSSITQAEKRRLADRKRLNVLVLGVEGDARTDTIIFISYDLTANKITVVSIPRDTYFHDEGYNRGDQRKINAVYGRKGEAGSVTAVSKLLGDVHIDYYVSVDYEGVEEIVDAISGVELEVPLDMEVGGMRIERGRQMLHGKEALQYLRFRKEYKDGDLGRIKAQQKLIRAALSKVHRSDLPGIIQKSISAVKTNMPLNEMLGFAKLYLSGAEEVEMYILPGFAMYKNIGGYNWSYFFHDRQKVKELIEKVYSKESIEQKRRKKYELY